MTQRAAIERLAARRAAADQDSQTARRDRASPFRIRRCIASPCWSCSLARRRPTIPVARRRARPGAASRHRLGRAGSRWPDARGTRRRFRAWIFTAVRSRHRFVYPTFEETTARAIEACEAAWDFFGGIFTVLIPDNTKAIILAGRSARPPHHAGVSRVCAGAALSHRCRARAACPGQRRAWNGPSPASAMTALPAKCSRRSTTRAPCARRWCLDDYGLRRHSRTQRRPLEHFRGRGAAGPAAGADHAV